MKICFVLMWGDGIGGTNRAIYSQVAALCGRHHVEVVSVLKTADRPFYDLPEGVSIRYLVDVTGPRPRAVRDVVPDSVAADLAAQPSALVDPVVEAAYDALIDVELEHMLRTSDADVLVSATPPQLDLATRFAPASVAVLHQEHRTSEARRDETRRLLLDGARRADAVVLLTEPTASWLRDGLGDAAPAVEVIPNAVPDTPRPRSRCDNPTMLSAGRFVPAKQLHHAIDAFVAATHDRPGWSLRLFGEGPLEEQLQRRITRRGLADRITLPGVTPYLEREWSKASIGVLSSRSEGFPLVIGEAMAAGVPFVSYDCPNGPAAMITHDVDGLLVPAGDAAALAAALRSLAGNEARRREMGQAALEHAARFSSASIAARWLSLYDDLARHVAAHGTRRQRE